MSNKCLYVVLFILVSFLGQAQKDLYVKGLQYFEKKNYEKALEYFYADKYGNGNKDLLLYRIISNYQLGNIQNAKKDVSAILGFDNIPDEIYLYIGKIFHSENNFQKAAENYKNYLRRLSPKSDKRGEIIHMIKQCGNAIRMKHIEATAFVDNFGSDVNSKYDDFRMIQSPNFENKYYFTSARLGATGGKRNESGLRDEVYGTFNSDMYSIEMINGKWDEVKKLNPFINSSRDEMVLDFSRDGSVLYFIKGPNYNQGIIYTDTFAVVKDLNLKPRRFMAPINAEDGDVYAHWFSDDIVFFASDRDGGYGGFDIYVTYRKEGKWSKPKNLGPGINSKYNEVAPHVSDDGKTVYFSSDRLASFGGYDIFKSNYQAGIRKWAAAENMGLPVNSSGDDLDFFVAKDGFSATLSSNRKGGEGGFDLYIAYFKNQELGQLADPVSLAFISEDEFIPANIKYQQPEKRSSMASSSRRPQKAVNSAKPDTKKKTDLGSTRKTKKNKKKERNKVAKKKKTEKAPIPVKKEDKKKEYIINPLYYESKSEIISPTNERELEVLVNLLSQYEDLDLEIRAHTNEEGLESYDLYFSIKRAETVGDYLVGKGIDRNRISLKGYGSNYPVARTETGGKKSKIANKVNSRIEFTIKNAEKKPIQLTVIEPYLVDYLRDPRGELFKTIESGLSYRVQIASVKQMYQNQVLLLYNDSMIEKEMDSSNFRYTLGLYEQYEDAKLLVKDLNNYSITGAFIVPYIDGRRLNQGDYKKYADQYPDLLKFIENNDE